jgi:hypothetical protein
MTCKDFEAAAADLARGHLMDSAQRERALGHSASCASCALRLADEQALTGGLRILAKVTEEQVPARVEAALLAAFRQHAALPAVAPGRSARQRWLYAAAGVAAIAMIVMLLALVASRTRDSQQPGPQKAAKPAPAVPDETRAASPQQQAPTAGSQPSVAAVQTTDHRRRGADRVKNVGRPGPAVDKSNKLPTTVEIATDFIPLMNRESLAQMDGGQVMRVELPRSALMSFGLPMNMERATERIKADVVVGNDGLARAIRFVR